LLDTRYRVEIPGGIKLEAQVVGPIPRCLAFFVDLMIRGVLLFIITLVSIPFGTLGFGFWMILMFLIEWFYPVLFEVFRAGQTPGKKMLGISVVRDDLSPVNFGASMVRNLLRTVDFLPLLYLAGLITMISNRRFQRLGDLAAGTLVISVAESAKLSRVENLQPMAPPMMLTRPEQSAVVDFLHRSQQLSEPRQKELAALLVGVTHKADDDGVDHLHRIGAWFLGMR
jgi:uncharacterized RDD family membrane protein YckC